MYLVGKDNTAVRVGGHHHGGDVMELLTVKAAMEIIPLCKTKVTAIINSLPHINTGGKLLVERKELEGWIKRNTVTGATKKPKPQPTPKQKRVWLDMGLTEEGLIPYRKRGA